MKWFKENREESIIIFIVIVIICWAIFSWAISPSTPARYDELPCEPDFMGGCN